MKNIDIPNRSSSIETALVMVFSNILLSPTILIHSSVKRQVSKFEMKSNETICSVRKYIDAETKVL
jgi:hypothetical protein